MTFRCGDDVKILCGCVSGGSGRGGRDAGAEVIPEDRRRYIIKNR